MNYLVRKMKMKTTILYCLTSSRMSAVTEEDSNKDWRGNEQLETITHC